MEIYNTVIENTNTPEVQRILKELDSDKDVLMTALSPEVPGRVDIQMIQPINTVKCIGTLPEEVVEKIRDEYGTENVIVDISDYAVTYDNGVYGLVADINAVSTQIEIAEKKKRLPLLLIVLISIATAVLTVVLIIIRLLTRQGKK